MSRVGRATEAASNFHFFGFIQAKTKETTAARPTGSATVGEIVAREALNNMVNVQKATTPPTNIPANNSKYIFMICWLATYIQQPQHALQSTMINHRMRLCLHCRFGVIRNAQSGDFHHLQVVRTITHCHHLLWRYAKLLA